MEAPSFASRRPAAGALPAFSLPSASPAPEIPSMQTHPSDSSRRTGNMSNPPASFAPLKTPLPSASSILTPPSGVTSDGLSPSSGVNTGSSQSSQPGGGLFYQGVQPPWPNQGSSAYTYSSATPNPGQTSLAHPPYGAGRSMYSPSMPYNARSSESPATTDGLPAPFQQADVHSYHGAMSGGGQGLPSLSSHQASGPQMQNPILNSQNPVSQPPSAPSSAADYRQQPPTPAYSPYPASSTPGHSPYPSYAPQPSPTHPSPTTSGPPTRGLSSLASQPSLSGMAAPLPYGNSGTTRPGYPYHMQGVPGSGPVMSNLGTPGGQLAMVSGGMPGMALGPGYHHAHHHMPHMYGHGQQTPQERPFKCDQCLQSFNRNHDLKRHKRIHLAVKPFPCTFCDKSFSRKDALKRHRLVKGCGSAQNSHDSSNANAGGNDNSPPERSDVMSDSTNESPKTTTKNIN